MDKKAKNQIKQLVAVLLLYLVASVALEAFGEVIILPDTVKAQEDYVRNLKLQMQVYEDQVTEVQQNILQLTLKQKDVNTKKELEAVKAELRVQKMLLTDCELQYEEALADFTREAKVLEQMQAECTRQKRCPRKH